MAKKSKKIYPIVNDFSEWILNIYNNSNKLDTKVEFNKLMEEIEFLNDVEYDYNMAKIYILIQQAHEDENYMFLHFCKIYSDKYLELNP